MEILLQLRLMQLEELTYEFFVDGLTQGAPSGVRTLNGIFNNGQQVTVAISVSSCTITSDPITIITNPNPISTLTAVGVVSNTICENNFNYYSKSSW